MGLVADEDEYKLHAHLEEYSHNWGRYSLSLKSHQKSDEYWLLKGVSQKSSLQLLEVSLHLDIHLKEYSSELIYQLLLLKCYFNYLT